MAGTEALPALPREKGLTSAHLLQSHVPAGARRPPSRRSAAHDRSAEAILLVGGYDVGCGAVAWWSRGWARIDSPRTAPFRNASRVLPAAPSPSRARQAMTTPAKVLLG
jgi:hypothetical protein